MTNSKACPEQNELVEYLLGKLPEELLETLETHFENCDICEETLRGLNLNDTLNGWVGDAANDVQQNTTDQRFVSKLIDRLQTGSMFQPELDPLVRERANEVVRLLGPCDQSECIGILSQYQIEELIGAGSSGVVFRAVDLQLNRPVAIKILRPSLGEAARERFMIEARAAASVDNPNVVTIYQVGEADGLAFIAMQWLPGETLEQRLQRATFLTEEEVRQVATQIATGLEAAHRKTLIHRDIKPANIWLCEENNQVKLLDFGLARIADDDPHMTSTGMLAGTPYFMSPEQSRGQELDGRSDLFSLGCLMYRASTGKMPFGDRGILATLQSIQSHQPVPPRELNALLTQDFSDLVMSLLEKQPANRPDSAEHVANAINSKRSSWKFNAVNYQKKKSDAAPQSPARQTSSSGFRNGLIAATLLGMLAWGWHTFGEQIIRIATDKGQIVVETTDEDVEIEILSDGNVVRIIDVKTEQKIDIVSGEYQIQATSKTGGNSFEIQPDRFVMHRGDKQIVAVKNLTTTITSQNDSNSGELVYDGKTFDQWMNQLKYERSVTAFQQGATAIGALASDNPEYQERAIELVTPLVRKHGNQIFGPDYPWTTILLSFFNQISPDKTVEFAINEIRNGNTASRSQVIWHVATGSEVLYRDDFSNRREHIAEVKRQLSRLLKTGLAELEKNNSDADVIGEIMSSAIRTSTIEFDDGGKAIYGKLSPATVSFLENEMATFRGASVNSFIASRLVQWSDSKKGLRRFAELLSDPAISAQTRSSMFFDELQHFRGEKFAELQSSLFAIIESDTMADQLVDRYQRKYPNSKQFDAEKIRNSVRSLVVGEIGQYGNQAAVPKLKELAVENSELSGAVKSALTHFRFAGGLGRGGGGSTSGGRAGGGGLGSASGGGLIGGAAGRSGGGQIGGLLGGKDSRPMVGRRLGEIPGGAGGSKSQTSPTPLYEGKSFTQWLRQLRNEKSRSAFEKGAVALAILSEDNSKHQKQADDLIRKLVRRHGGLIVEENPSNWTAIFIKYFANIGAERSIKFAIEEIKSGTDQSRAQAVHNVTPSGTNGVISTSTLREYAMQLQTHLLPLIKVGHQQIEENESTSDSVERIIEAAIVNSLPIPISNGRRELPSDVVDYLEDWIAKTKSVKTRAFVASQLVSHCDQSKLGVRTFASTLADPKLPGDTRGEMLFKQLVTWNPVASSGYIGRVPDREFNLMVPALIKIFESDALTNDLLPAYKDLLMMGGMNSGFSFASKIESQKRIDVRLKILEMMKARRQYASDALPLLEKLKSNRRDLLLAERAQRVFVVINKAKNLAQNNSADGNSVEDQKANPESEADKK